MKNTFFGILTDNSTQVMSEDEKDFVSMQRALYFSLGFELLGALLFLITAFYVVADKKRAEEAENAGNLNTIHFLV